MEGCLLRRNHRLHSAIPCCFKIKGTMLKGTPQKLFMKKQIFMWIVIIKSQTYLGKDHLKTRAVCAIRYDIAHTNFYPTNYEINRTYGPYESFERELFEMASIVMFKYSLQVRIGNMDGIFVAYHNVKNMLGFQYIPLSQMDSIFFGRVGKEDSKLNKANADGEEQFRAIVDDIGQHWQNKEEALSTMMADYEFNVSLSMLQDLLNVIMQKTGSRPFRMFLTYFAGRSISDSRIEGSYDPILCILLFTIVGFSHVDF